MHLELATLPLLGAARLRGLHRATAFARHRIPRVRDARVISERVGRCAAVRRARPTAGRRPASSRKLHRQRLGDMEFHLGRCRLEMRAPPPQTDAPWRPPPGARRRRRSSRPSVAMYRRRYAPVNPRIYRSWEVRSTPSGRPARFFTAAAALAPSHRRSPPAAFPSPRPNPNPLIDLHRPRSSITQSTSSVTTSRRSRPR